MPSSRSAFLLRFLLPAGAAIALFVMALYALVIPAFERAVMERKREMIRELANVAWSTLEHYVLEERSGRLNRATAQAEAIEELRQLRYGPEAKDYYWIIDLQPRMLMHPYVPGLEGKDLRDFTDATGKRLFVEQVEATAASGSAYVEYIWQWKDDAHRQTPKLSYVRRFQPWGWIVGTGLYVEDVRHEMAALRRSLLWTSGGITLIVGGLLVHLAFEARRSEARRLAAEGHLLASEARYRTLVRASTEGLLMLQEGHPPFANRHLASLLGRSAEELAECAPGEILVPAEPLPEGLDILSWLEQTPGPRELRILRADGSVMDALLTHSKERMGEAEGTVITLRDVSGHRAVTEALDRNREWFRDLVDLEFGQLLLYQSIWPHLSPALLLPLNTSVAQAAERMTRAACGAVVVTSEAGLPCGMVTDRDLRERLLAASLDPQIPLARIMSAPLVTLPETALLIEGLRAMEQKGISHLAVASASGMVIGLLEARRLMAAQRALGEDLLQQIHGAQNPEALAEALQQVPALVRTLRQAGLRAHPTARFLTSLADAAAGSALAWAQAELGPAPAPFALVAMGSQGRGEMTLGSDQDQGLIYADGLDEAASSYFLRLGARVADILAQVGYPRCPGGVMAGEPAWNGPLAPWKRQFSRWVGTSEPKDLLEVHICFDLRLVQGDATLIADLQTHVREAVAAHPPFLLHLAQGILNTRATITKLGAIVAEDERLDLKQASAKLGNTVRVFALKAGLAVTGTLERLDALRSLNPRMEEDHPSLVAAFEGLLGFRLDAQLAGEGNLLDLRGLTEQDKAALKKSLQQIELLSSRLSFDVLGHG